MNTTKKNLEKYSNYSREQLINEIEKFKEKLNIANDNNNDLELLLETITDSTTKLENQIYLQNKEMSKYINQVNLITQAAISLENDTFQSTCLDEVATRVDPLGILARVIQRIVHNLKTKEDTLIEYKAKFDTTLKERNNFEKLKKKLDAANENNNDLELLLETITDSSTKVENELHLQNKEMSKYIEQVNLVTKAAIAVENGTFQPHCLDEVVIRVDPLGILARVFQRMVHNLKTREKQLAEYNANLEKKVKKRTEQLEIVNQELERLVNKDGLTKVANRRYFDQQLQQEWLRLKREKQPLSLILIDVDFFKFYNDYYGHQAGDDCLIQVAQAIKKAVHRSADLVARYGGEEFVVILPNTDKLGVITVSEHIQQEIHKLSIPHEKSEVSNCVSVSLGIASIIPTQNSSPEKLILFADQALYQAKKEGRDRYIFSDQLLKLKLK